MPGRSCESTETALVLADIGFGTVPARGWLRDVEQLLVDRRSLVYSIQPETASVLGRHNATALP